MKNFFKRVRGGGTPSPSVIPADAEADDIVNQADASNHGGSDIFAKVKDEKASAVVTIEMTYPRAFGIDSAGSSQATGFVVDKVKGIILTNKHVVQEGPVRAKARFKKNEELDLTAIYRDPVHDFGFFTFKPEELTLTPHEEIELDPSGATKGKKTLIIGNNGGERLSFVETTVARTDRPYVPMLDLNTFYITASDTGVGGSSGAPMLSTEGKAVAMVAAGNDGTNISMYLPLHRVARALEYIRRGEPIPRGTLQVGFKHKTFEALVHRKAITDETVKIVKAAFPGPIDEAEGLLVVEKNLPKGPGREAGIKNGDVLYKLNGNLVHNFIQLAEVLDTFVGREISLAVIRDTEELELKPTVQDLREITNTKFVEVSNGIFHGIQYLVALHLNLPIEGVFLAQRGYMFSRVPFGAIIKKVGKRKIESLDDFIEAVKELPSGKLVSVRYQPIHDQNKEEVATVTVDKRWYPFNLATRNDSEGKWFYTDLADKILTPQASKTKLVVNDLNSNIENGIMSSSEATGENTADVREQEKLLNSLVEVSISIPFSVDGNYNFSSSTAGIIVNKDLGIVLSDRNVINTTLCDVQITFNKSKKVHGKVLFIHPQLPYSFLKYDPDLLADDHTVSVKDIKLSKLRPRVGEKLDYVGVTYSFDADISEARVTNFRDVDFYGGDLTGHSLPPAPMETVGFNIGTGFGMFLDKNDFSVKALSVSSYFSGCGIACDISPLVEDIIDCVANNTPVPQNIRLLPITTSFISLSEARIFELNDSWAQKLQSKMTIFQRKLIVVKRRMVTEDVFDKLKENDIILAIDGTPVTLMRDYLNLLADKEAVSLSLLRDSEEIEVIVKTTPFSTLGTSRIIHFAGLILQEPHPAIHFLSKPEIMQPGGVYVSAQEEGSPADAAQAQNEDFTATGSIIGKLVYKCNGKPVANLDDLVAAMTMKGHNEFVRLLAKDIKHGEESVHDIRLDLEYWKSRDMHLDEHGNWISVGIQHAEPGTSPDVIDEIEPVAQQPPSDDDE